MKAELTKIADLRSSLAAAGYDPATEGSLARLLDVMQETGRSIAQVSKDIGISPTTVSRLLSGKYQADLGNSKGLVHEFLRRYEEGRIVEPDRFVETEVWQRVKNSLDFASQYHQAVNIVGNSQIGKTFAVAEYQRRAREAGSDHVVVLRMPSLGTPMALAGALCRALGIDPKRRLYDMYTAIMARISPRHLIVVDEIHQAALGTGLAGLRCVELLREIHDTTHCGLVLIGTNVWRSVLKTVRHAGARKDWLGWLEQTQLRGIPVTMPEVLPHKDIAAVYSAYGLPEPDKDTLNVVRGIAQQQGLGRLVKRLQAAATAARAAGKVFEWQHFLAVHGQLENYAGGIV